MELIDSVGSTISKISVPRGRRFRVFNVYELYNNFKSIVHVAGYHKLANLKEEKHNYH